MRSWVDKRDGPAHARSVVLPPVSLRRLPERERELHRTRARSATRRILSSASVVASDERSGHFGRWRCAGPLPGMLEVRTAVSEDHGYRDLVTLVVAIERDHDRLPRSRRSSSPTKGAAIVAVV